MTGSPSRSKKGKNLANDGFALEEGPESPLDSRLNRGLSPYCTGNPIRVHLEALENPGSVKRQAIGAMALIRQRTRLGPL